MPTCVWLVTWRSLWDFAWPLVWARQRVHFKHRTSVVFPGAFEENVRRDFSCVPYFISQAPLYGYCSLDGQPELSFTDAVMNATSVSRIAWRARAISWHDVICMRAVCCIVYLVPLNRVTAVRLCLYGASARVAAYYNSIVQHKASLQLCSACEKMAVRLALKFHRSCHACSTKFY